jgi:phage terminase large subunit GpA-like protein
MDSVSLASYRAAVGALLMRAFANWSVMPPEVWAEEVRRMLDGQRFRWSYAPYLKKMYLSIFDKSVQETVFELFSRAGKSEVILNAIGFCIDQDPRRILNLWPTEKHGEKFSKDNLTGELFDPTPCLQFLGSKANKRTGSNTLLHKLFPGGLIDIFGANSPGDMRRAKGNFLYGDEVDSIQESQTDEGDQLMIFKKRGDEYPDTIKVFASYPSLKGRSRIHAMLEESDFQQYFVTCVRCGGEPYVMHRRQLRYEAEKPEEARMECPVCRELLTDDDRYAMMLQGRDADLWRSTKEFRGKRGFQANSMLWPHPVDRNKFPGGFLQMLAQKEIDADKADNPERSRRIIVNTEDAEPYEPKFEQKVDFSTLYLRREDYDPKTRCPEDVLTVTFGADLQQDRLEVEFVGHGLNSQTWGLGYRVIYGEPLAPHLWDEFDKLLINSSFITLSGRALKVGAGGVDSSYKPDTVDAFTRPRLARRIWSFHGSPTLGKPIVSKPTKRGRSTTLIFEIGTNEAKDVIYQRLELAPQKDPATGNDFFPHGYSHFPKETCYDEKYFKGLTIENAIMKKAPDGEFYKAFICPDGARNEPLDCRVYANAALAIWKPDLSAMSEALKPKEEAEQPKRTYVMRPGGGWRV